MTNVSYVTSHNSSPDSGEVREIFVAVLSVAAASVVISVDSNNIILISRRTTAVSENGISTREGEVIQL